jgi:hypothetical protein
VYREPGFPGAEDLGNLFHFTHDFAAAFCAARRAVRPRGTRPVAGILSKGGAFS